MLRRLGKRGLEDKIPFIIWEIIVIMMVVVALTVSVRGIANNTTYWKKYHSADLALMTDLMITNQGDFNINYNLKELQTNTATKALHIEPLIFQTFLRKDAFFVYDKSFDEDRFPQSYIYARDLSRANTVESNTTNDYITLHKVGNTLSMGEFYEVQTDSCPSESTTGDTALKHFEALNLDDPSKTYSDYVNRLLSRYGNSEKEMRVFFAEDATKSTSLYYDTSITNSIISNKMTCLIKKQILQRYPNMNVIERAYDSSFDNNAIFTANKDNSDSYNYWIIIQVKKGDLTNKDLAEFITAAIEEYYK